MARPPAPDPQGFGSLFSIVEDAATRWGDQVLLALRTDDGTALPWTGADLLRHSKAAAWRLRSLGIRPGDRLLTWSPSTPELPAVYFGAMRAGIVLVPLDLRMAPDAIQRIIQRSGARWLAIGEGLDAPDPSTIDLSGIEVRRVSELAADPSDPAHALPAGWEADVDGWPMPGREDLFEVIYTSGTTGQPKGVMLSHGNILATIDACSRILPPREHRAVSTLPLSHLFEQAPVLLYGTSMGASILYVRSRNPRVLFEALREHGVTTMVLVPLVLELFWNALMREVEKQGKTKLFERARRIARRLPYPARRLIFRNVHRQLGGRLRLFVVAGAYLPPRLQEAWEDLGIAVLQGYGATECGPASATSERDHPTGSVGRTTAPVRLRLAPEDSEIQVTGPTVFKGYWQDPEATAASFTEDGWYRTGDIGRVDEHGNLVLTGRRKNIIVLPSGLNVYPEDIETALLEHGIKESVVLETAAGRVEAVVLAGDPPVPRPGVAPPTPPTEAEMAEAKPRIDAAIKAANATLAVHQRVAGWRFWPEGDFPRTHTLKVKRDPVREWVGGDAALKVREDRG